MGSLHGICVYHLPRDWFGLFLFNLDYEALGWGLYDLIYLMVLICVVRE
jgi:hypothetical protein